MQIASANGTVERGFQHPQVLIQGIVAEKTDALFILLSPAAIEEPLHHPGRNIRKPNRVTDCLKSLQCPVMVTQGLSTYRPFQQPDMLLPELIEGDGLEVQVRIVIQLTFLLLGKDVCISLGACLAGLGVAAAVLVRLAQVIGIPALQLALPDPYGYVTLSLLHDSTILSKKQPADQPNQRIADSIGLFRVRPAGYIL